jgi:hypothetical protein
MSSVQLLAALGNLVFVGAVVTIAIRLLLLWRRTREWPELLISSGFLALALVGFPLLGASGLTGEKIGDTNLPMLVTGLAALTASVILIHAFTWRVFRPRETWAAVFVAANGIAASCVAALFVHAVMTAPADTAPIEVHGPWSLAIRMLFEVWYAWVAVESLTEWSRARKRLSLGLSDPVVVNRFALWGSMGVVLALNGAAAMVLEARGLSPMTDVVPAILLGLNGAVAGSLMFLTFVPPAAYVERIRRHHAARIPVR